MSVSPKKPTRNSSPRSVMMNEVREQLSMPGVDSGADVTDAKSVSSRSSKSVSKSIKSSPPTTRDFFGKSQSLKDLASTKGDQERPSLNNDKKSSISTRWSKAGSKSGRRNNNQLVADFFDVQSLASEPASTSSRRNAKANSSAHLETHSVTSKRSTGGNFAGFFFKMKKIMNDEVPPDADVDEISQFSGIDMLSVDDEDLTLGSGLESDYDETVYDGEEESTDAESVVVKDTIRRIIKTNSDMAAASPPPKKKKKKISLLGKIFMSRKERKARKVAKKEEKERLQREKALRDYGCPEPAAESRPSTPVTMNSTSNSLPSASRNTSREKPQVQIEVDSEGNQEIQSLHDSKKDDAPQRRMSNRSTATSPASFGNKPEDNLFVRPTIGKSSSCRWSCDSSVDSSASAPKRPVRRRDSRTEELDTPRPPMRQASSARSLPSSSFSPPTPPQRVDSRDSSRKLSAAAELKKKALRNEQDKALRENLRREMALRSGRDLDDLKDHDNFYDDDSDESVLSLLSGLLAAWSAERDGAAGDDGNAALSTSCHSLQPKKSILKTSDRCDNDKPRYSVVFDNIDIREYERTVGDNPSCSRGPPISIGWQYVLAHSYPIDDYEFLIKAPKRSKKDFHLNADIRTYLLLDEWGYSEEEVRKARREVTYIQYCRAKSSFSGVRNAAKEAAFLKKATAAEFSPSAVPKRSVKMNTAPSLSPSPLSPPPARPTRRYGGDLPPSLNSSSSSSRNRPLFN